MSIEVQLIDEAECKKALGLVRSDSSPQKFVIFGHPDNNPNRIGVICSGDDTAELANNMDDGQSLYIIARYERMHDMSSIIKFVYIHWEGTGLPFVLRGKLGVIQGSIDKLMGSYHLSMVTSSRDELSDEAVNQKLMESAGQMNKVVDVNAGNQERGFTSSQVPRLPPKMYSTLTSSYNKTQPKIKIDDKMLASINAVRANDNPIDWCLAHYENNDHSGSLMSFAEGSGDLMELKPHLDPSLVLYGLYRVTDIIDDIKTVKFVLIVWVGSDIKPFTKAKVSAHRGAIEEAFKPFHVSVYATDLSDVSDKIVNDKVMSASGSKSCVK